MMAIKVRTDLVVVQFLAASDWDGSRLKIFPYERMLCAFKHLHDVCCSG